MRFDQLEPLVHQRRRIDRDLRAHRPIGVRDRLRRRGGARSPRPMQCGTARRWRSGSVLRHLRGGCPQGIGKSHYARCRPAAGSRRGGSPLRSSARRRVTSASLLASATVRPGFDRRHDRHQAGAADDRRHHQLRLARRGLVRAPRRPPRRGNRVPASARSSSASAAFVGHHGQLRAGPARDRPPAPRRWSPAVSATTSNRSGERSMRSSVDLPIEPVAPRMAILRFMPAPIAAPSAVRTATGTSPSSRSSIPPWPGSQSPESLTPARRFIQLSNRSPPWAASANSGARTNSGVLSPDRAPRPRRAGSPPRSRRTGPRPSCPG